MGPSQKQAKSRIRRSNQGSMYVSSNSIEGREYGDSNSARVLCKDGQEIEICLQDAMQCFHFVAILQWYIDRKNSDVEKKNEEVCRAGTSEKVHDGADGFLEATALWKRFLVDFALSETQVLILYVFTESICDIYFHVLFGESLSLISLSHTSNHT